MFRVEGQLPKDFLKNIVVRRDDDNDLKRASMLEANGQRKRERPKQTKRRPVEKCVLGWRWRKLHIGQDEERE